MSRERDGQAQETPKTLVYALLAFTGVMLALGIYWAYQFERGTTIERQNLLPLLSWAVLNLLMGGVATLWSWAYVAPADAKASPVAPMKLLILTVGGTLGLTTFICLGLLWVIFNNDWSAAIGKGRAAWRDFNTWIPVLAGLGGLVVTFVSLLAVKSEERSHPALRRLIYGYNTFLSGFLLLAILAMMISMVHFYGNPTFDWTASNIYGISDESKRILRDLKTPVHVYVVFPSGHPTRADLEMMLSSFRASNPKMIDFSSVSPVNLAELTTTIELQRDYGWVMQDSAERDGVAKGVIVVAEKEGDKPVSEIIKRATMEEVRGGNPMGGGGEDASRVFKGEQTVMTAIVNLTGGKTNQTIYFTQGNGEPKLDDFETADFQNRGLSVLKNRLESKGYVIKELNLVAQPGATPKVPDDAFIVVVAGPQRMEEAKVEALREYAKLPKGKLIVLLDVNRDTGWKITPTGLEKFLSEFGIQASSDVVLNAYSQQQVRFPGVLLFADAVVASQPDRGLADAFRSQIILPLVEVRSIRLATNNPNSKYTPVAFLETFKPKDQPIGQWSEANVSEFFASSPQDQVKYATNKMEENKTANAMAFPLAVTVREKSDQAAADPHAFMNPDAQGEPKLVVFGDATFVCNWGMSEGPRQYFDLFNASLAWLRGRPDLLQEIPNKTRSSYTMQLSYAQNRVMQWYPGALFLIGIVACGLFVFMVRRR